MVTCLQSQQVADIFDNSVEFDGAGRVRLLIGCERVLSLWKDRVLIQFGRLVCRHGLLPQAQDTLAADQQSYATGTVEFDRVIKDVRNLLTLQAGYHRAVVQLSTALARIEQAVGTRP